MSTLLIIGGSGFFGKSILDAYKRGLLSTWHINRVIAMSRNAAKLKLHYPELISDTVELLDGDISKVKSLPYAKYVIHAAASTDASRYLSHSEEEKRNIIGGVLNYCRLAPRFHKGSKIVFCSSGAIYGYQSKEVRYLKEDMAFGDIEKLDKVKKSYAYAKKDAESAILTLGQSGLNVSIARCFSFVGKYLPRNQHFAIGNFISDGLSNTDISVRSDRTVYRSYMYADDLVRWLVTIAENSSSICPIYNVGSDEEIEIGDLANIIANMFNVRVRYSQKRSKQTDRYIPSVSKALYELGLTNSYTLKDSILSSIDQIR